MEYQYDGIVLRQFFLLLFFDKAAQECLRGFCYLAVLGVLAVYHILEETLQLGVGALRERTMRNVIVRRDKLGVIHNRDREIYKTVCIGKLEKITSDDDAGIEVR